MGKFGWSYPPGAANDPHAPYNQSEDPSWYVTATRNAESIFRYFGAKNWGQVYRALYKGTDCGVSIGIKLESENDETYYCDDLYKFDVKTPVVAILISSIVEGVDATTETVEINITKKGTRKTGTIIKRLFAACEAVEKEAKYIWDQSHGCEDCGVGEGEYGEFAVNPKCKSCHGRGIVI
jgi:hypothetical protein